MVCFVEAADETGTEVVLLRVNGLASRSIKEVGLLATVDVAAEVDVIKAD